MTQFLPPNLLAMFQARPPIPYAPPLDLHKKKQPPYLGLAAYLSAFEDPKDTPPPRPPQPDTKEARKKRKRDEKDSLNKQRITEQLEHCTIIPAPPSPSSTRTGSIQPECSHNPSIYAGDPQENPEATADAYKTLFVARVSYDTNERRLKREFEEYGPVKKVCLVKDKDGKPRGYAFIEFEKEKDMRCT